MSMHETDIRRLQNRETIDSAWKIWEKGKRNLDALHIRFNAAATYTQNEPKGKE